MQRRRLIAAAPLLPLAALSARAQGSGQGEWRPTRPINLIVPFAAGSGTDAVARTLAPLLAAELEAVPEAVRARGGVRQAVAPRRHQIPRHLAAREVAGADDLPAREQPAGDVELASDGTNVYAVWQELPRGARGELRVTRLGCR